MTIILSRKTNSYSQYAFSILIVAIVSITGFYSERFINYQIVALLLLMVVSLMATVFHIKPVLISATLSALVLNYFFIPPIFTFHIATSEDILLFAIYFIVALVGAVLSYKIRQSEKIARDKEEKENTINLYNTLLNSLSHELRTPIATIVGSVDTLKENNQNLTIENQAILLNEIDTASMRLNAQVENLLNMSRLESGILKLNLDWCDVNELVYSVIQKLNINSHKLIFKSNHTLPLFKLDAGLIEQVMVNIIHNAVLYTPPNSNITIEALFIDEKFTLIISDTGNGFPENEIKHVFDKFYRLPQTKAGGTGLGLSIAKGFVEAHLGNIRLESTLNKGATFTITIPAQTSFINNLKHE